MPENKEYKSYMYMCMLYCTTCNCNNFRHGSSILRVGEAWESWVGGSPLGVDSDCLT